MIKKLSSCKRLALVIPLIFINAIQANSQQLGNFSTADTDEYPLVWWLIGTPGWNEGLIKTTSSRSPFGRSGFGIHMDASKQFGFWSTGWDPLLTIEGGTGNSTFKGKVGIGTTPNLNKLTIAADVTMNNDIDIAQLGISGSDYQKRLVLGYDVNGDGFGYIKAGYYTHVWTALALQPSGGKVGVGTTSPTELLTIGNDVYGPTDRKAIKIGNGGFSQPAGHNTSSNGDKIILYSSTGESYDARIGIGERGNFWMKSSGSNDVSFEWYAGNNLSTPKMMLSGHGNLSIGTSNPNGYMLAVAGKAIAESVTVKPQGAWPDFVFKKDYQLMSLTDTEAYIKRNGHLPDILSAEDIKIKNLDLGEMNMKLLQKVEELTLHLIEMKKEIAALKSQQIKE